MLWRTCKSDDGLRNAASRLLPRLGDTKAKRIVHRRLTPVLKNAIDFVFACIKSLCST